MKLIKIDDLQSPTLEIYKTLRDNRLGKENFFIADSPKVVNTLLQTDIEFKSILATKEYYEKFADLIEPKKIPTLYVAAKELMEKIVGHKIHHNVMACGVRKQQSKVDELGDQIVMLDAVTSTQNVGSIARSTAAMGVDSLILSTRSPHPYARRALRVSMGHISKLKYSYYEDIFSMIEELKQRGYRVYGAEVTQCATALAKVKVAPKWVLLMGSEGEGLSQKIIESCDEIVTIEMAKGVRSLNVAVASSILIYKFQNP